VLRVAQDQPWVDAARDALVPGHVADPSPVAAGATSGRASTGITTFVACVPAPTVVRLGCCLGRLSAAGARGGAVHQVLGARLDPREEARHDAADAEARVALDVGRADQ